MTRLLHDVVLATSSIIIDPTILSDAKNAVLQRTPHPDHDALHAYWDGNQSLAEISRIYGISYNHLRNLKSKLCRSIYMEYLTIMRNNRRENNAGHV